MTVIAGLESGYRRREKKRHTVGGDGVVASSDSGAHGEIFVDCLFGSGLARPLVAEHALLLRDLAARSPLQGGGGCAFRHRQGDRRRGAERAPAALLISRWRSELEVSRLARAGAAR